MSLLIRNGTVITASDMYRGDVYIEGERITTIGAELTMAADRVIDAAGKYVLPGGIDVHTHLDMPFGGTTSADDFESGTIAAAHGGTTTIVDFAIQYRGQTLHHAMDTWMAKAEGKAAIDYGFHMIITELTDQVELEMDALVAPGDHVLQAVHGLPGRLHARRCEHFPGAAAERRERRHDLHACREWRRDRRARQARAGRRQDRAEVSRPDPAGARRGGSHAPRHRAGRDRRRADLHRASLRRRSAGDGHRGPRPRPAGVRGNLPAVSVPVLRQLRGAWLRRREVRDEPAASVAGDAGSPVARPRLQRSPGDLDRPLPVLHEGAEGPRPRRFLEDPEWRARASRPA